jgi:hypothetical protein
MSKTKLTLFFSFFLVSIITFSQVVEEIIQLDTISETYKVIYKPITSSSYYTKKIAVFADDTSQVAIEKTFNKYGQNGVYKVYYPSGRLKVLTVFANNKINGEWTWYDKEGIILVKGVYKEGVKNGYWAYKSIKFYGRYKKGLKHRRWVRVDVNKKKHASFYKHGVFIRGEGHVSDQLPEEVLKDSTNSAQPAIKESKKSITPEYEQAISYLTDNIVFRKALKSHFGGTLKKIRAIKKHYKNDRFQFVVSPSILSLDYSSFYKESNEGKIQVAIIDSLLKTHERKDIPQENNVIKVDDSLFSQSTNKNSPMVIYFSELNENLMRIDVLKYNDSVTENEFVEKYNTADENQKFSILLYYNNEGVLKGAEYQKP